MSRPRVLIVDDEPDIRELCRVNFELEGFDVLDCGDGNAAIAAARDRQPAVIFLDLMMPAVDGWEVLGRLKNDGATADIPVVLLTASTGPAERERGRAEGAHDFVAKPFDPLALVECARRVAGEAGR